MIFALVRNLIYKQPQHSQGKMMQLENNMARSILLSATILALQACGGGPSTPVDNTPVVVTGSQTGVLIDSAVEGVEYTTSSGVTGKTNTAGQYKYNPGDTVSFKLGSLTLAANVAASNLLTPLDLASGSDTRLNNLLVILQSLDSDGNASNGISIPAVTAAALPALDLSVSLDAAALQRVRTAASASAAMKTAEQARAHFMTKAPALLASNVWVSVEQGKPVQAIRFATTATASGVQVTEFLHGQATGTDNRGQAGVEYGSLAVTGVNAGGFSFEVLGTPIDTNGEWGFSHYHPGETLAVSGNMLVSREAGSTAASTFSKMENDPKDIVGAWAFMDGSLVPTNGAMLLFFASGRFMMVDPVGDVAEDGSSCGGPGIETGRYTYDRATKVVQTSNAEVNTNGCAGLFENGNANPTRLTFTLDDAAGTTATLTGVDAGGEWSVRMKRVSN